MRAHIFKFIKIFAVALVLCVGALVVWNATPNKTGPFPPDPAVIHVNKAFASDIPYRENYFEYESQKIHYVEAGEGPLVVLVHGFPAYWYAMIRQMEALKGNYRVVAIDTLGAGLSDAPRDVSEYLLEKRSAHLKALIEHLAPNEKTHLIGHDWGGGFVFGFAQRYPGKVISVTGISSPPPSVMLNLLAMNETQKEKSAYVEKIQGANAILVKVLNIPEQIWEGAYRPLLDKNKISVEESELFRNNFQSPKRIDAYLNWYRANIPPLEEITETDYWPSKDARLEMPILIIRGMDDPVFVSEYIDLTKALSPEPTILELEGIGHWPHMEATDKVNESITEFIKVSTLEPF